MSGSKARQYPPQDGVYAVKVKSGAGWQAYETARLQISVGQPYHEGDKMAATIDWVRHRFGRVIVCVNDTLQRFNHQLESGLTPMAAYQRAYRDGNEWLTRNGPLIASLAEVKVHRWEDWKTWPDFAHSMGATLRLYDDNQEFRAAVEQNIAAVWERRRKRGTLGEAFKYSEFARQSRAYLLEETAIFSQMFARDRAVDVYSGSVLLPCAVFQGRHVAGMPKGLGQGAFTRIDFARNGNATPEPSPVAA